MPTKYKCCRCGKLFNNENEVHRLLYHSTKDGYVEGLFCCQDCDRDISEEDTQFVSNGTSKKDPDWSTEVAIFDKIKEKQNG